MPSFSDNVSRRCHYQVPFQFLAMHWFLTEHQYCVEPSSIASPITLSATVVFLHQLMPEQAQPGTLCPSPSLGSRGPGCVKAMERRCWTRGSRGPVTRLCICEHCGELAFLAWAPCLCTA